MTTYHVLNEHTLCYKQDESILYGVLAGKPHLGGHDWINGAISVSPLDSLREASIADFDFFRVSHKGYIS